MKRICALMICLIVFMSNIVFVYAKNSIQSDYIDIGNPESESGRIELVNVSDVKTREVDKTLHTFRAINPEGYMTFTLSCDAEKTNYLTVKLWGGDTGSGMLWLTDTNGNMNISGNGAPARNNSVVDRRDWVELNTLGESPQYDGGFIYSTYIIPKVYTEGKTSVTLKLFSTGGSADYADTKVKDQTEESRGIYALYMTQDACFEPSDFELVTGHLTEPAQPQMKAYEEYKSQLLTYVKDAVETFKEWQIYKTADKNYPSYMEGMITRSEEWQTKDYSDTDWKDAYYKTSGGMLQQNMTPLDMYEVFTLAYQNTDAFGYSDEEGEELLDRVVKGIDFLVRAQGSNGGFFSLNGWIGGPQRTDASGNNLTGFGLRSAAYALDKLYDDINNGGYLSKYIDSDADGYVETSRRRKGAWENMAVLARDYLVSLDGAGHAPNQDMADIIAALRFNSFLKRIKSSKAWTDDEIINQLDIAMGIKLNISTSSYWVSPKGLILENFGSIQGGYSGDYGILALEEMSQLSKIAEENLGADEAEKYKDIVNTAYKSSDNFMFTANAGVNSDPTLYSEGLISNRNSYYPGTERYVLDEYAALEVGNSTALKAFYNFLLHDKVTTEAGSYIPSNVHFEDNALSLMRLYLSFDELTEAFETQNMEEYSYMMENDAIDEYAWADEMGRNVVIKNGDDKIYLALNWRNPLRSVEYYNTPTVKDRQSGLMNNLARVHHKTERFDRYGYAELTTVGWNVKTAAEASYQNFTNHYAEAFMYMNYGDYTVLMNSNNLMGNENNIYYNIPYTELELNGVYKDLITGNLYYFGEAADGAEDGTSIQVAPASTMVLYKSPSEADTEVTAVEYTDNIVSVFAKSAPSADLNVYAAEYRNGTLVNVKRKTQTITGNDQISFEYKRVSEDSVVRVFVWDDAMKPLYQVREW